jgi:RNA polymerase sigma-70 factor (ECF subfamily)
LRIAVVRDRPFPSREGVASIAAVLPLTADEAAVLAAARDGDEAAFGRLVDRHRREIHRHCARMLGSAHEAEDAVQDTFLRAWLRLGTFEARSSFAAWLYRIATNVCLDAIARRGRAAVEPVLVDVPAPRESEPDAVLVSRETVELALLASIRHLPARQHASLVLRDVLGLSAAETATALSLSVPATTSALQRARCGLRRHLAGHRLEWATVPPSHGHRERLACSLAVGST